MECKMDVMEVTHSLIRFHIELKRAVKFICAWYYQRTGVGLYSI